jgi:hypothetical protein
MKTFVIVSDTHGNRSLLDRLDGIFAENNYIIHLGDTSADGNYLKGKFGDKVTVINGNCDPVKLGFNETVLECEGVKIFCCHGHLYSVKYTPDKLAYRAQELGCQVALYGHTHWAAIEEVGGVTLINPGTLSRYTLNQTYGYMVIQNGKVVPTIAEVPPKM